jgi:Rps23 Pro-64 3,4-dihydroxylase Tpa1-like proline 4-hydroxylase
MVYYLNPQWDPSQGGKLRIFTKEETIFSVDPKADTLAMFWSDQIVHDVTPTTSSSIDIKEARRYALTLWLVSDNDEEIVNTKHPLYPNRQKHFPC